MTIKSLSADVENGGLAGRNTSHQPSGPAGKGGLCIAHEAVSTGVGRSCSANETESLGFRPPPLELDGCAAIAEQTPTKKKKRNPAPIGLLGFGMTTVTLMFVETGWAAGEFKDVVMGFALFYGGLTQWVAGIFELVDGNTFAASAFISYGCFWVGWFLLNLLQYTGHFTKPANDVGETLWLVQWGIFTTVFAIATLRKSKALRVIFFSLALTFYLLAGAIWNDDCKTAAGYVGIFCGTSACYTAVAEIFEEEWGVKMPLL